MKAAIALMIYVTFALNFFVPFNLCFYYLKQRHPVPKRPQWELVYRAIFVCGIGTIAIVFPEINAIMGFVSNPYILVYYLLLDFPLRDVVEMGKLYEKDSRNKVDAKGKLNYEKRTDRNRSCLTHQNCTQSN